MFLFLFLLSFWLQFSVKKRLFGKLGNCVYWINKLEPQLLNIFRALQTCRMLQISMQVYEYTSGWLEARPCSTSNECQVASL